jgi:hypothetical protein
MQQWKYNCEQQALALLHNSIISSRWQHCNYRDRRTQHFRNCYFDRCFKNYDIMAILFCCHYKFLVSLDVKLASNLFFFNVSEAGEHTKFHEKMESSIENLLTLWTTYLIT